MVKYSLKTILKIRMIKEFSALIELIQLKIKMEHLKIKILELASNSKITVIHLAIKEQIIKLNNSQFNKEDDNNRI